MFGVELQNVGEQVLVVAVSIEIVFKELFGEAEVSEVFESELSVLHHNESNDVRVRSVYC